MTSIKTKFSVGIFVIAGSVIVASALIWFGLSNYLEKGKHYAAYFEESVQGLGKDSAVKFRGVNIGRVESIDVAPDDTLICVVLKVEKDIDLTSEMAAQLKSVGITGIMFVELDKKRKNEPDLSPKLSFKPEYPVVSTKPSDLKKYMLAIEDAFNKLNALDVKGISDRAKSTLDAINEAVNDVQITEMSKNIRSSFVRLEEILDPKQWQGMMRSIESTGKSINSLIVNVNGTVSNINKAFVGFDQVVQKNEAGISNSIADLSKTMQGAGALMGQGAELVQKTDQSLENIQQQLSVTLQNLEQASRQLNLSMERIADQPSLLIFSKPLPEREIQNGR
jgi:phospholipid/cholesterol/gamma-HCH transport system substrate-binding protein